MVGEALDNAERHSQLNSDDGDWAMTGYLVKKIEQALPIYRIHVAMLSVGATVEESILSGPAAMIERMEAYVSAHTTSGFTQENLRTVFALQDGVTKDHGAASQGRGGTGFQDIFDFFYDLGGTPSPLHHAQLAIISGSTCIKLGYPYFRGTRRDDENSERELWFNRPNTPSHPPDPTHVFTLPSRLRGTLVSMAIPLDTGYLEAVNRDRERL